MDRKILFKGRSRLMILARDCGFEHVCMKRAGNGLEGGNL